MSTIREQRLRLALEIAGVLAVLVGLIFVGLELRQNTAAMQAATFQDLVHASSEFNTAIATDPDLRRIYFAGWQNPERLDESDREAWLLLQASYWMRMQNVFNQYQRGTLIDSDWQIYRPSICGSARSPGGSVYWPDDVNLNSPFKEFLESCGR